ncbi:alpha/beta hydrolase [Flammeovirgaceae bacterium SG7u.111]|nr:alpha/beta hydrolase [Flammeovirgaceae bacterium SG7u.132]WPO35927.1 alpha/beta hydrolase [Flammeovirgaceae bacterium SG7u.111]
MLEKNTPIQFSHSNGFPASSYQHFFKLLAPYPVTAVERFGMGKYQIKNDWKPLVAELIDDIESKHSKPVIGVGHSLGGVLTAWAAIERPDLFAKIIFIDPPLFRPFKRFVMRSASLMGITDKVVPPARSTKKRRSVFESKEQAYELWKHKKLFKNFDDQCFQDYVEYGLSPSAKGVELIIPPNLEYKIFTLTPAIIGSADFSMPSYFLYSGKLKTVEAKDLAWLKKKFKKTQFMPYDGGHMYPMEEPEKAAGLIKGLINSPDALG